MANEIHVNDSEELTFGQGRIDSSHFIYEVQEHKKKIEHLEKVVLLGNGNKPLTERVTAVEVTVDAIKDDIADIKASQSRSAKIAVTTLATLVIGIVVAVVTALMK